jgi:hypothetical protein
MSYTANVPIGKKVLVHSGPRNIGGVAVAPPFDVAFAQIGDDIINLWNAPSAGDIYVAAKTAIGSTQVKISSASNPGKDMIFDVNVVPDDTFDHFEPSGEPPVSQ